MLVKCLRHGSQLVTQASKSIIFCKLRWLCTSFAIDLYENTTKVQMVLLIVNYGFGTIFVTTCHQKQLICDPIQLRVTKREPLILPIIYVFVGSGPANAMSRKAKCFITLIHYYNFGCLWHETSFSNLINVIFFMILLKWQCNFWCCAILF